jgi:hypothetical protein
MPGISKLFDGKKFMWDGLEYATADEAKTVASGYNQNGFETRIDAEDAKHFVYSRKEVKEVVVSG